MVAASIVGAFIVGTVVGIAVDGGDSDTATAAPSEKAEESSGAAVAPPPRPQPEPEPEPTYYEPTPEDYLLTIKVLEQTCFGSAGCNVSYRIEVTSLYLGEVDPNATYELTYEIQGGEDTRINTLEITGDRYSVDEQEMVSTPSEDTELAAVVTDVSKRGL
ncbi:hypothetical protein [Jiangella mangrovi]|uniref:Uncharacterized protein n=1 Tax=Jiangella mangrovi TaxID=1524084 RepID=A0A7W9GMR6_9ACTN|nr:hypothetical protein [Jiangella mangrovi]MBB5786723.1 hypothetical protein [Jiangella mangrovi]